MKICILENDTMADGLAPPGARVADWFTHLLRAAGAEGWQFDAFHTPACDYPPSFDPYDAVILTGSRSDAFGADPWIETLRGHVDRLLAERKTLVGVCFGHQMLGLCLGAPVGRAEGGWVIGVQTYRWHDNGAASASGPTVDLLATHQDQVKALPPGARLLASSPTCPIAGFTVGDHVFSLQPHPELDAAILTTLIERRRERLGADAADAAIRSLERDHEGSAVAAKIIAFIVDRRHGR